MNGSDEIREGHLCPICMVDYSSIASLHAHFSREHSDDIDLKKFFKGVVDHAKKIIKQSSEPEESVKLSTKKDIIHNLDIYNKPQKLGARRSNINVFKEIRNKRLEGFSAETNKLIIRLDKLLTNVPSDPSRKKLHEQTIVPWIDGDDVFRCPECAKAFHIARRKHHCRLCGSIMCNDCSCFLTVVKARSILSRAVEESPVENVETNDSLRICQYCMNLLESREAMKANRNYNPIVAQLYDQIRTYLSELDGDAEMFNEMSLSLNEGRSTYHFNDARDLWEKIMKLSDKVGALSSKIANLGTSGVENTAANKELKLQKSISLGVNGYIQSKILVLPSLPSEEAYKVLQENRRRRIEKEIREHQMEEITDSLLASQIKTEFVHCKPTLEELQRNVTAEEGWKPDVENLFYNSDNPIIQQINNIKSYIKQAREAYKFDEVACLEKNLQELQEEYYRQQKN